jgi:hypothetical protein
LVSAGKPTIIGVGYRYQPTPILTAGVLINRFSSSEAGGIIDNYIGIGFPD